METIEIKINDQLFVNNKWYFDIVDINDNIIKVRIQYKENPNIEKYLYKNINIDKSLFDKVEEYKYFFKCTIDENKLRQNIGNLISRIKIEKDYSFIYEDAAVAANSAGMGDVAAPGINSTPGAYGSVGSADFGAPAYTTPSEKPNMGSNVVGEKKKKKTKKDKIKLKTPTIKLETFSNINDINDIKTNILNLIDYPDLNKHDLYFVELINKNKVVLMNSSIPVVQKFMDDLKQLNNELYSFCSEYFMDEIEKIINYDGKNSIE